MLLTPKKIYLLLFILVNFTLNAQEKILTNYLSNFKIDQVNSKNIIDIQQALKHSKNDSLNAEAHLILGKVYYKIENYEETFKNYTKALLLSKQLNSISLLGNANDALGNLQFKLENFDKAEYHFKKSLEYFILEKESLKITKAKGNLAILDIKNNKIDQAITSLKSSINDNFLDKKSKAILIISLGNIYLEKLNNTKVAISYYQKALNLLENSKEISLINKITQNIAECYIQEKNYSKALQYNKKSDVLLELEDYTELRVTLYLFYANIYEAQGKNELALTNYKKYLTHKDKLDNSKRILINSNQEILNQLKSKEIQNEITEQKVKNLKTEKSLANAKIYALILTLLITFISIYLIYKKQKNKIYHLNQNVIASQDRLKFTEDRTEKILLNVNQSQEYYELLTQRLKEIILGSNELNTKQNLQSLLLEMQNGKIKLQKNDELYNDSTSTFIYNLEKKHSELTEEEKRICELIFLGYKNKEIAVLVNLSVRSIENCRYRIRKKINLNTLQSLHHYLLNLNN